MMFEHNEVFEGFKDRTLFAVPHDLKEKPTVIHGMVRGVDDLSWYISFDEKCIYVGFQNPPNKRFMFSWD